LEIYGDVEKEEQDYIAIAGLVQEMFTCEAGIVHETIYSASIRFSFRRSDPSVPFSRQSISLVKSSLGNSFVDSIFKSTPVFAVSGFDNSSGSLGCAPNGL